MKKLLLSILMAAPLMLKAQQTVLFYQPFNSSISNTVSHYLKGSGEGTISESARFSLLPTVSGTTTPTNYYDTNPIYDINSNGFAINHTAGGDHKISPYIKGLGLPNGGSGANELIFLQAVVKFNITTGLTSSTPLFFQLGNYTAYATSADPSGGTPAATNNTQPYTVMGIKFLTGTDLGKFQFSNSNISTTNYDGTIANRITWIINKTGANKTYKGLDNMTTTVNAASSDIWLGNTKIGTVAENSDATGKTQNITDLRIRTAGIWQGTINIKELTIGYIPADGTGQVLPVELTSFLAKANTSSVNLSWSTASESNASHFNITRSTDGAHFHKIGQVTAKNQAATYSYIDFSPAKGINYYQLIQEDFDGKTKASEIVTAKIAATSLEVSVKGSPKAVELNINTLKNSSAKITLTSLSGQLIGSAAANLNSGQNNITIPTTYKGMVIATVITPEATISKKTIK